MKVASFLLGVSFFFSCFTVAFRAGGVVASCLASTCMSSVALATDQMIVLIFPCLSLGHVFFIFAPLHWVAALLPPSPEKK